MTWKEIVSSISKRIFPCVGAEENVQLQDGSELWDMTFTILLLWWICAHPPSMTKHRTLKMCKIKRNEVMSNLPLQMAAYFNVVFSPVWVIVLLNFLIRNYSLFSRLVQLTLVIITCTIFAVEIIRLYMLYEGNLNDKIPELAGFWMLSVFLQLPLQGLLLFNPHFHLDVLEIVCQTVIFILLCVEIIFGYFSLRYTARQQANFYKLKKSKADYGKGRE